MLGITQKRRCDEAMKRAKERCYTPFNTRWKCTGECKNCICCLMTLEDGSEEHFDPMSKRKIK